MGDFELSTLLYGVAQTLDAAKAAGAGEVSSICLTPQLWMRVWQSDELAGWNLEKVSDSMEMTLNGYPLVSEPFMPLGKDYYVTHKLPQEKPESIIKAESVKPEPAKPGTKFTHAEFLDYLQEMRKISPTIDELLTLNQDNFDLMSQAQQRMILTILLMSQTTEIIYTVL